MKKYNKIDNIEFWVSLLGIIFSLALIGFFSLIIYALKILILKLVLF